MLDPLSLLSHERANKESMNSLNISLLLKAAALETKAHKRPLQGLTTWVAFAVDPHTTSSTVFFLLLLSCVRKIQQIGCTKRESMLCQMEFRLPMGYISPFTTDNTQKRNFLFFSFEKWLLLCYSNLLKDSHLSWPWDWQWGYVRISWKSCAWTPWFALKTMNFSSIGVWSTFKMWLLNKIWFHKEGRWLGRPCAVERIILNYWSFCQPSRSDYDERSMTRT